MATTSTLFSNMNLGTLFSVKRASAVRSLSVSEKHVSVINAHVL